LYTCTGTGSCYGGCSGVCTNQCDPNAFCAAGSCASDLPVGVPCIQGCMCQSNTCGAPFFGCLP
jgi:hypothetical protein